MVGMTRPTWKHPDVVPSLLLLMLLVPTAPLESPLELLEVVLLVTA